ncbi:serine/threonine protein kinase RCK2 NDAI_0G05190 [Naumovozyma dairenensis CBS 421]|uniref:non-specific serine/threonine protein kinase n=1 Tax=Naumovozyma dairenensis (strain ATCC 10597 / BCRC 20456 / CBS 421 / NBRC 0211 / NRRL Y-12639) TaxID=1071378 RepID=J7RTE7_NAUDC|nr:hypothetical protein NDAI_0G05190 [Naumovozyma dairenensis CBS 421]CCK73502.1 hypothetical protein NDAI_0G05190 [Naumovozyma dairenensis CBS 421]
MTKNDGDYGAVDVANNNKHSTNIEPNTKSDGNTKAIKTTNIIRKVKSPDSTNTADSDSESKISMNLNINIPTVNSKTGEEENENEDEGASSLASSQLSSLNEEQDIYEDEDTEDGELIQPEHEFSEQLELQNFKIINKIGEGAFSKVFRAVPIEDSPNAFLTKSYKEVAIKVIKKTDLSSLDINKDHLFHEPPAKQHNKNEKQHSSKTSSKEQVLKEVMIHKAVTNNCDNIVAFVDFQESKTYYYLIQELLHGGEIFGEIVKLTYFSEDLSRHVIKQLAIAIKHMHSLGIVHRDIKPENLLFEPIEYIPSLKPKLRKSDDPQTKVDEGVFTPGVGGGGIGVVKLADFGLSKQIFSTNTKTPCGTVGYTAPEVVKDERYSMKVDMWGIGCVLYTMLCGFPPFYDEKIDTLTEKISRGEYTFLAPWWDEISNGAKNAVMRLLEVDPNRRYDIDEFLADPWLNTFDCEREKEKLDNAKKQINKRRSRRNKKFFMERDSTLLYSPAAVAMRDAFDISNAVQRIEEDKRDSPYILGALAEDEEEEFRLGSSTAKSNKNTNNLNGLDDDMFQLKLDTSTILKRRQEKNHNIIQNTTSIPPIPGKSISFIT